MYLCFNWPEPSPPVFSVPLATVQLWPHNPQYLIGCLDCPSNCLETLWPGEPKREQRQRLRKHRGNDYPRIHSIIISTWLCSPTSPTVTPMIISNDLIIIKPFVILIGVMEFISSACQMIISSVRNMDGHWKILQSEVWCQAECGAHLLYLQLPNSSLSMFFKAW